MKKFTIFIVVEAIIFLVAGIITFFLGNITIESYATILLYCGLAALATGVFMEFGSKQGAFYLRTSSGQQLLREMKEQQSSSRGAFYLRTSSQQQLREMKELQSSRKGAFYLFLIGIVPIAISYGSTVDRAFDIKGIYESAAPIPGEIPTADANKFLTEVRNLVKDSIQTGGGILVSA